MKRNLIILPDGREVFSGAEGAAILALEREETVNSGSILMPGAVCAAMAQMRILDADDGILTAGDPLTLYQVEDSGARQLVGEFIAQKPTLSGKILTVTAYDKLTLLDKALSAWLGSLDGWPYSLWELASLTCGRCGLEFLPENFPNGDFPVQPFPFDGVTGRQLMGWIAQAAGCFCRATPEGAVTFDWYADSGISLSAGGTPELWCCENGILRLQLRSDAVRQENTLALETPALQVESGEDLTLTFRESSPSYYQGGLSLQEFSTPPIDGVQIRQSADDVGTTYPANAQNRLILTGNPLLAAQDAQTLLPVAQTLWEKLRGISYTPCTVTLPENDRIKVGQILRLGEQNIYVMQLRRAGGQMVITCRGEKDPEGAAARSQQTYDGLAGKILKLRTDVEGIFAQNSDSKGKLSRLQLDVEGLRAQTEATAGLQTQVTKLEQTAEKLALTVETINTEGAQKLKTAVGYTFDDRGLQISREGQQMKNLLDNTGMYVTRNGQTVLQANDAGVTAVDVKVGNFLVVGDHARFENYGAGRTACYWLEG